MDVERAVQQIEGERQAAAKWPAFSLCAGYLYPPRLNREQSSSEAAARYKAELLENWGTRRLIDLTGGMGADTYFMAAAAAETHYCEQDEALCETARQNFAALGRPSIACHAGDSLQWLRQQPDGPDGLAADVIYIDPARRDTAGRRVAAFEDCTPNLLPNLSFLLSRCRRLLVKASPMIDLAAALAQIGAVEEVHIVALRNECKEALFVVRGGTAAPAAACAKSPCAKSPCAETAAIHCVNLPAPHSAAARQHNVFTLAAEAAARPAYAAEMQAYLYEPNAALMKGGSFGLLSEQYGVEKLARNTHLYTSADLRPHFPGRILRVLQPLPLNPRDAARLLPGRKAHVAARNHPLTADQVRRKLRLTEGGDLFVVAATLGTRPSAWLCQPL